MREYREFRPSWFDERGHGLDDQQHWLVHPCTRNRDSGICAESNFHTALDDLGGESETVEVHRFGHWGNGWFEIIIIDPSDPVAVKKAEDHEASLHDYPILDDFDYSQREYEMVLDYWRFMSLRERIKLCADNDVCYLAARHDYPPSGDVDPNGSVYDRIAYWVNE